MRLSQLVVFLSGVLLLALAAAPRAAGGELLVVLSETGERREGLPVVVRHPQPDAYLRVLTTGYSGRLLRLYGMAQRFARPGRAPQPAYLVLSNQQGGFPRYGFYFDGPQPETAYVDLHRNSSLTGRAGAMDQIFPHELLHIIVRDLAGDAPDGQASQVHAVAVRTDRITAFNEGFAEHGQAMAIDDPDALPETRGLASALDARTRAYEHMAAYRRALASRWSPAPKARMIFPLWFSGDEQVLRYHAVKENRFAREPAVPDALYAKPFSAYLLENVLPGEPDGRAKPAARMLATEGVVSALFYRMVNDRVVQTREAPGELYARFGVQPGDLDPLEHAYLKIFAAIEAGGYDAAAVIRAYERLFPDDRPAVRTVVSGILLGQALPDARAIWLLNDGFSVGTSLFDQYRGLPRSHTFDLNAASLADLVGVAGVDLSLAHGILAAAPFTGIEDLARVPGMTASVLRRLGTMQAAMERPPDPGTSEEGRLSIRSIVWPYARRALAVWVVCAIVGAILYRAVRRVPWWRLCVIGGAAGLAGLIAGWTIDPGSGLLALAAPVALYGLPGAVLRLWRTRSPAEAGLVVLAWAAAAVAPALAVVPLLPL